MISLANANISQESSLTPHFKPLIVFLLAKDTGTIKSNNSVGYSQVNFFYIYL